MEASVARKKGLSVGEAERLVGPSRELEVTPRIPYFLSGAVESH